VLHGSFRTMKRIWSNLDLHGKFRLLAIAGLVIWLFNFFIVYFEINHINQATMSLERFEDLYNSVLEIRRYEKNFLLYKNRDNLNETIDYFNQARQLYAGIADDPETIRSETVLYKLGAIFEDYRKVLETDPDIMPTESTQEKIRSVGKQMVNLAESLLAESRKSVAISARNGMRWPLTTTGLILVLFVLGAILVNRKVVKPLVGLERATKQIGRGDFGPIHHADHIESEVDRLVIAFNSMVEELEARQEQIIHSRKIASLGTLVSGVAHELNNPINNIILTIDSLVGGRKITDDRRATLLQDILDQAIRASGIVKNLLEFSRSEASTVQDIELPQLLQDTIRIAGNQIALSKIKVHQHIAPRLAKVRGNRQELQQVLLNLIINSVQAMPAGGDLIITVDQEKDKKINITVQDTGVGIPEKHLPYIFDPFFTTKEVGQGTGLGLSVSYGIIHKHGGRISVDNCKDKGCKFTVAIPCTPERNND
jgi:two-component system, NtrC family, sensor kinase